MGSCADQHVLVLAAGRSGGGGVSGRALLEWEGHPWWLVQKERLDRTGIPASWVISREVRAVLSRNPRAPARLILAPPEEDHSPVEVVARGIEVLEADPPEGVFLLPIETPAPAVAAWEALCIAGGAGKKEGGIAVPVVEGRAGFPVYLPWRTLLARFQALSPATLARAKLDRLFGRHPPPRRVAVEDEAVIATVAGPEDVRRWSEGVLPRRV